MKIVENIETAIKSKELQTYVKGSLENFISFLLSDAVAPIKQIQSTFQFAYSIPNLLFWDKLKRFMTGVFSDFEMQVKMCEKFNEDNETYRDFIKRQIHLINEIDDDNKIDYFAHLTRSVLLEFIDRPLYFKLASILKRATREELEYVRDNITKDAVEQNFFVNSLLQLELTTQTSVDGGFFDENGVSTSSDKFSYTPLATCLDRYCLSYGTKNYQYHSGADFLANLTVQKASPQVQMHVTSTSSKMHYSSLMDAIETISHRNDT